MNAKLDAYRAHQAYYYVSLKRFFLKSLIIFIFQYLMIMALPFAYPALPWYPPMGLAFVWFYLLGKEAWMGIFFGGLLGYGLKGLPLSAMVLYLSADILCGYWGAYLCQNSFASDLKIFKNFREWLDFFKKVAMMCMVSAGLRCMAIFLKPGLLLSFKAAFFYYLDAWFADLNAILILGTFLFSWVYIPFSRAQVDYKVVCSALLFIGSGLYLAYCAARQVVLCEQWGIVCYTALPALLFLSIACLIKCMCGKTRISRANSNNSKHSCSILRKKL